MHELPHSDFQAAFITGTHFDCPRRGRLTVSTQPAGDIVLTSGSMIACDPGQIGMDQRFAPRPFTRRVQPGRYPVSLAVVQESTDSRVGCAKIQFTDEIPRDWEMALTPNQSLQDLPRGNFWGYGVETGTGSFIDAAVFAQVTPPDHGDFYESTIFPAIEDGDYSSILLDSGTGGNAVTFRAGYGDGSYPSYWGLSKNGKVCCLVTDFGLLVEHLEGKTTVRLQSVIDGTAQLEELAAVGIRVEADPQPDPNTYPNAHGCCLRLHGETCESVIINGNKEYSSHGIGYSHTGGVSTFNFRFTEPLDPRAKIRFEYGLGVRALKPV